MVTPFSLRKYFVAAALFFLFMAGTSVIDIMHDAADDLSQQHFYFELFTLFFSLLGASFFVFTTLQTTQKNKELIRAVKKISNENTEFKKKIRYYSKGLSEAIDSEFERWDLTPTEKQVGLLVLKGLSTKNIGEVLGATDKTIRHHCSAIYKKSNLSGRTELSAYFLEDLLVIPEKSSPSV